MDLGYKECRDGFHLRKQMMKVQSHDKHQCKFQSIEFILYISYTQFHITIIENYKTIHNNRHKTFIFERQEQAVNGESITI